ncbi:unnamed protein product [Nippostrongylus brasiliensis]|uniref:DUF4704 domain-containing protein n=1 Tax=Nippostrongylus brasiliensis TaxID=27835 RepID=A0A158QXU8_NIPBR|nr:unnamed protein product [Nippostrongylus brasiliensis]
MSVSIQDPRCTPRHIADQLKRFIQLADAPPNTVSNGTSLSDAGFVLLSLKDQILVENSRSQHFWQEFISRPLNGVELLSKVLIVLQGIVNSSQQTSSKFSNLLSRNSSNTNRKRKAAVAEADCIECMKILLEKSDNAWRRFLDTTNGLDAVLFSVNSPQLDSKCYALEILLLLLDQTQGFVTLMRALTALTARSRDYVRFSLFIAQLKHGLHTNKLHIQILIVRLFNKLLSVAPSPLHRTLVRSEIILSRFSVEYVESLISAHTATLGGVEILADELSLWASMGSHGMSSHAVEHNNIYGSSETESDTAQSDRIRHGRPPLGKYPIGSTSVVKNVERQRFKKQGGLGSGGRASAPGYYPESERHSSSAFYPDRRSLTLSNRSWQAQSEASYSPSSLTRTSYEPDRRTPGVMRRAKSESAMAAPQRAESPDSPPRGLKRFPVVQEQQLYHPIQHARAMSRSVHDLSTREDVPAITTLTRPNSARPSSARAQNPRFAEPPTVEAQLPHAGFSYLFPSQPVVASVVPKRTITPDSHTRQLTENVSRPSYSENGQVVYIPINMDNGRREKSSRYDRTDGGGYPSESRTNSRAKVRSPSINGGIGDDVRDALSQFDYLNEYDNASLRGRGGEREVSYHF